MKKIHSNKAEDFRKSGPRALNLDFTLRVLAWISLIAVGTGLISTGNIWASIIGIILNGLIFVHGVELEHQCLHNSAYTSRRANRLVGAVLGTPMLVSYIGYRESHLWHHRFLGTPRDREFFDYKRSETLSAFDLLKYSFNFKRYPSVVKRSVKLLCGYNHNTRIERDEAKDFIFMGILIAVALLASFWAHSSIIVYAWLIPNFLIAEPVHNLVELPEHIGCDNSTKNVYLNTRSIRSNRFITWYTNSNNFHVEHHTNPGVPMQLIHLLHEEMLPQIRYFNPTYYSFFVDLIRSGSTDVVTSRQSDERRIL